MTARLEVTQLGPTDVVPHRVFTHPDHIEPDRAVMRVLIGDLNRHVVDAGRTDGAIVRYLPDEDQWFRRVVIPTPGLLAGPGEIAVVGFFGRMRDVVAPETAQRIAHLSRRLVEAVLGTPGILGYSTHLLADERNYANLVLLRDTGVIEEWRAGATHEAAARIESPNYYEYVRIYRGSIRLECLAKPDDLRLCQVKYWDYRGEPVWMAVRDLA